MWTDCNGCGVSFRGDVNVMELDSGNGAKLCQCTKKHRIVYL